MLRVLHVTPYFAPAYCYGGPPRSVLALCGALQDRGLDVSVVTTSANGRGELPSDVLQSGAFDGIPVRYVVRRFPKRYFFARGLRPLLRAMIRDHDLVHIHGCWNYVGTTAATLCRRYRRPYVVSPRGMLDSQGLARSRWKKKLAFRLRERANLAAAAAFHVTGETELRQVAQLGLPPRLEVIPNVVDLREFEDLPSGAEFRRRLGIGPDERIVITVGRLHPHKGLDLLLEAIRCVGATEPPIRFVIVGGGNESYRSALARNYHDLMGSGRCVFAGHLQGPDRLEAYAAADMFVSASESESFGMSIAEALAANLPVVVSRDCPWPQVEEWSCGARIERTPAAFADAIVKGLHAKDALQRPSLDIAQRLRGAYGPQAIASRMCRLYARCLNIQTEAESGVLLRN